MIKRLGKKGKANAKNVRELKKIFSDMNVTFCENCGTTEALSFAHSLKRRHIHSEELMKEVACLCLKCHMAIEARPESEMTRFIRNIIANRGVNL